MELNEIASLSGKGGLFKIVKPTRNGVILESLDHKKSRLIAHSNQRVSTLHEISIYTTTQEGAVELETVLSKIWEEFKEDPGLDSTSSPEELRGFMTHILPDYDESRVYVSDIKRLISWYKILLREVPEILKGEKKEKEVKAEKPSESEDKETEKEKKPKKVTSKKKNTDS